jgi:probable phosphoglycerate mutase
LYKEIYLIRHGETELNRGGIFRGRLDVPLNENGLIQADYLGDVLKNRSFDTIYSSPLSRATQTAKGIIKKNNNPPEIKINKAFHNIDLGEWQGQAKSNIEKSAPAKFRQWIENPEKLEIPGGESILDVRERAWNELQRIVGSEGDTIAIVTHRSVLKCILGAVMGLRDHFFWKFHLDNASYSIIEWNHERGFILSNLNSTYYLKEFVKERV